MKKLLKTYLILTTVVGFLDIYVCDSADDLSTIEPEASTGCLAPDLRFSRQRKSDTTTEAPYAQFETTQIYLPEDFTTSDIEFVEKIDIDLSSINPDDAGDDKRRKYAEVNPYRLEPDGAGFHDIEEEDGHEGHESVAQINNQQNRRRNSKKRRFTGGRRRRIENENGSSRGRGRFERHAIYRREAQHKIDHRNEKTPLPPVGDVYYVEIADLLKSDFLNKNVKRKLQRAKPKVNLSSVSAKRITSSATTSRDIDVAGNKLIREQEPEDKQQDNNSNKSNASNNDIKDVHQQQNNNGTIPSSSLESGVLDGEGKQDGASAGPLQRHANETGGIQSENDQDTLQRVKRKSGKTTGALSRPKGGGDSGSKSTSRKGDKTGYDEEGGFVPVHPEEESEEEEEEDKSESSEHSHFSEVSEIRFPGEVGPLGDRRLCKIRCVKGKWVGPLCATNEEDEHGNIKFQPLYKSCHVNRIQPHLLLSYRNISVNVGWDLPHGHSLQARCKDLGLYKLLGESRVLCSNGLWAPRMPSCVPTTLLTNFSDDSPPSIRIKIGSGSGAFEPSGVLAVLPGSTIHLDCMYPRRRGTPEWTWTGWFKQYYTGWSTIPEEKATKYRLTIKDIQNQDSGTFTCASPRGLTNSIPIMVATSQCPQLPDPVVPLSLRLEGNKLGQRALYRCPLGWRIDGTANSTCLASGNWSSPPPTCQSVQCPPLFLEDPHLSLTELNTSAWGRAVFKCSWGFRLSGPPGLECEPTGVWSGPVPRCRAIQCPQPLVPINGRIDGTSGSSSHRRYAVGALVTFSCTEGHLLVGEASIVCTETGFWSHPPPFCKSQCPYPGDPPNGLIAPLKFHYDPGDLLSVQCRPGFVEFSSSGPPERPRCLPDGNWSGPVPQCRSYEEV